uniref:Serine carboxypeptidase n=1 Tax=Acrobeloides nanus TaxID=290746 RepID=A0A914DNY1_9BILA
MIVGNGELSAQWDIATIADFMYFHGLYGKNEWDQLRSCCDPPGQVYCNLSKYLDNSGNPIDNSNCSQWTYDMTELRQWESGWDVYNIYQDCYGYSIYSFGGEEEKQKHKDIHHHIEQNKKHFKYGQPPNYLAAFVNQMSRMNYASTDLNGGFQCYMTNGATYYLNQPHVRDALHIPSYVQRWEMCSNFVGENYVGQYNTMTSDMTTTFMEIATSPYVQNLAGTPFKMLIYNGDVDLACGMMQAEYFIENFVNLTNGVVAQNRSEWYYTSYDLTPANVGFAKSFNSGKMTLDLLTVKGSGHMVPTDRPGPALQMLTNFLTSNRNFSTPVPFSLAAAPLKGEYTPPPPGQNPETSPTATVNSTVTPGTTRTGSSTPTETTRIGSSTPTGTTATGSSTPTETTGSSTPNGTTGPNQNTSQTQTPGTTSPTKGSGGLYASFLMNMVGVVIAIKVFRR